jgi:hypothetical protein
MRKVQHRSGTVSKTEIVRRENRSSGFRLRAPVRKRLGLTPAKRLNLLDTGDFANNSGACIDSHFCHD